MSSPCPFPSNRFIPSRTLSERQVAFADPVRSDVTLPHLLAGMGLESVAHASASDRQGNWLTEPEA